MEDKDKKVKSTPLSEKDEKIETSYPLYSETEKIYISNLKKRLESARKNRERTFVEFDGMSYTQYWNKCEEIGNTEVKPKKSKEDINFQSGTLRNKLFSFLNSVLGLNLEADITAYSQDDIIINSLGTAMETIIWKTNEMDQDEEKKLLRQYELIKHGTVFVEEVWDERYCLEKKEVKNYDGTFRDVAIETKRVKQYSKPTRNIIPGLKVYLGDLTKYDICDQPYIFTVQKMKYEEAEQIYRNFEMWKYVPKKIKNFSDLLTEDCSKYWTVEDYDENYVEVVKYQSKPDYEFQVVINGIPMFPIGFPFPWGFKEYNITQQNLKPIRADFAYGKSPLFENRNISSLIDEMMKMALLKTEKSFMPPYINLSTRVISNSVLMPGKISMGIPPGALQPISEHEASGVTNSEYTMIQDLVKNLDQNTVSQTFSGQPEGGTVTATQIVELQRQSRIMMGIIILSASLLEKKCTSLRLLNVLKNWFNPIDNKLDEIRGELKNKYRLVSRQMMIEGEGLGQQIVAPSEDLPDTDSLYAQEEMMKDTTGIPTRIIVINPKEIETAKFIWVINVSPKEKKSSELSKLMFNQMIQDATNMQLPLNMQTVSERFAQVWEEDPSKLFMPAQPTQPAAEQGMANMPGQPNAKAQTNMKPVIKPIELTPSPENNPSIQ